MPKIVIDEITSGYNLQKVNQNFQKVAEELNERVLYRDNILDENNSMMNDLDMNGNDILNANALRVNILEVNGEDLTGVIYQAQTARDQTLIYRDQTQALVDSIQGDADRAEAARIGAEIAEDNAAVSATQADSYRAEVATNAGLAQTARDEAQGFATTASNAATSATASQTAAATSASNAAGSATAASNSATSADNSATAAASSAIDASNSAADANQSAIDAANSAATIDVSTFVRKDGTTPFTGTQSGVAATAADHLTTRGQVEGSLTAFRSLGFTNNTTNYAGTTPMGNVIGRLAVSDTLGAHLNNYTVGHAGNISNAATPWSSGMGTLIVYGPSGSQGLRVDRARYVDRATCVHAGATVEYADVGNAPNTTKTTDLPDGFYLTGLRCGNGSVTSGSVMVSLWPRGKQIYFGVA